MQVISPGHTIGIIGGGQLGRMLAMAAAEMGYKTHIYCPEEDCPASHVATHTTVAAYEDEAQLLAFAKSVDVVTFEFENVPYTSLEAMEKLTPVRPSSKVLLTCSNRGMEKGFVRICGVETTQYVVVLSADDLAKALEVIPAPAILKTTELGYDGKGQVKIQPGDDVQKIWDGLQTHEAILEAIVDFDMEISVIVARNAYGDIAVFEPVENRHVNHILDTTIVPADVDIKVIKQAENIARTIAKKIELIGLLAVEMFVTKDGRVLVNELAPRPHNSGHWSMDGAVTSQFHQCIRAVCGLPLGSTKRLCDVEMKNLIGDEVEKWKAYANNPKAKLHLYGKAETRPGRKMGHVNLLKI